MTTTTDRRRFLQSSLAAGAALGVMGGDSATHDAPAQVAPSSGTHANPGIRPGLVHWRRDFPAACAASQASGKPVLHFQMMGRLDQRFC
jgi:hypothetical protein